MEGAAAPPSGSVPSAAGTAATGASTASSASSSVIQRLTKFGVPVEHLEKGPAGLIEFINEHPTQVPVVIDALFPSVEEIKEVSSAPDEPQTGTTREEFFSLCEEAVSWVQWLLFRGDPKAALAETGLLSGGQRGICGAVWGSNDIAYRCRTCEHDPTCAICVPCFQAGDHKNHDYSMIRTGGGCCDCGDATAWKQKGFCSRHRGPGFAPRLPEKFLTSAAPVLEALLRVWVSKLNGAQAVADDKPKKWSFQTAEEKVASQTSISIIDMLLVFCNLSESMLNFTAKYVGMKNLGLLDTLLRTESFLPERVVKRLHILLYKLLGDTAFKCSFAQEFICHYPKYLRDSVREESETSSNSNSKHGDHAILGNFSVQIFTVPTLTPKLVLESKLLDMLLETLKELFRACVGEDGRLLVTKGPIVHRVYSRVLEDIRYVMSHIEVAQYVAKQRPELGKAWLELIAFVQGMYPQRRMFNIHVEEENEDWESAYYLEMQMASIHPLYVVGAALGTVGDQVDAKSSHDLSKLESYRDDDANIVRHSKLGRITKETDGMDVGSSSGVDVEMDDVTNASCAGGKESQNAEVRDDRGALSSMVPVPLVWLVSECICILDKWLALDTARELAKGPGQPNSDREASSVHRRSIWRGRARGLTRGNRTAALILEPAGPPPAPPVAPAPAPAAPSPAAGVEGGGGPGRGGFVRDWLRRRARPQFAPEPTVADERRAPGGSASGSDSADMDVDSTSVSESGRSRENAGREWWMGAEVHTPAGAGVGQSVGEDWSTVDFDVSRQDVSFHIPLHRMVALLLHKALESHSSNVESSGCGSFDKSVSLSQLLPEKYRMPGFAALMMEHPLRLQVLCAQVQAGMWRRNGHTTSTLCELYRTVPWCEDSLELDLLILQCCSVLAPPEKFVDHIQRRFGLTDYFSLYLRTPNEYESSLAQEFIVLLIRLCAERGFCGLSPVEALRRELVQRLAVGDATHSSLIKALPRRLMDSKYLDECLNSVAVYRNPSGMQQGKYALREDCWRELDLYHPRWSLRELQSAEERYIRARKASPIYMQLPPWKKPFAPLQTMGRFVISARVHDTLRSVFFHAAFSENLSDSRAPEGLLLAALHLLSLALDVCALSVKPGHDGCGDVQMSGEAAAGCKMPDVEDCNANSSEGSEEPPLLARSIERVSVHGADGNVMAESHSLLSLLVVLLRKYGSGGGSPGTVAEPIQYTAGDVIKSLLGKFSDLHRGCMYEIESLVPEILHRRSVVSPTSANRSGTEPDEKKSLTDAERRKAMARERQQAILAKMKAAQERFVASLSVEVVPKESERNETEARRPKEKLEMGEGSSEENAGAACALCRDSGSGSPLCFLTLVQKSRILAIAQKPTPSWERPSSKAGLPLGDRSETSGSLMDGSNVEMYTTADLWNWIQEALADAATRERLLEGEALMEVFRTGIHPGIRNAVRLANAVGLPPAAPVREPPVETEVVDEGESSGENNEIESCEEEGPIISPTWWEQGYEPSVSDEWSSREVGLAAVLAEYVASVSRDRHRQGEREQPRAVDIELGQEGGGAVRARRLPGRNIMDATVNTGIGISDTAGVYLSACGHAVHQECLDRYFSTLLQRYYSRALFEGVQIVDPDMGEFLCPVCRRLANSIIPVLPSCSGHDLESKAIDFGSSAMGALSPGPLDSESGKRIIQLPQALCLLANAENMVSKAGFRKAVTTQLPDSMKAALETLAVRLHGLFNPDREHVGGANGRVSQSLHLWDVFRYSLMSAELAARTQQACSLVQGSLGRLLILEEVADARKGSVFPLLLHAVQAVQGQSRQVVLLRSRGMQLLADSILHGVSRDLFSEKSVQGNFASLLQYLEKSQDSPDVQFWKCMADPVLLHDPFSTLLWLLFCLPLPLPSKEGPFTALVHLFYSVCLTQVVAYAGAALESDDEVGSASFAFVRGVQETLSGTVLAPSSDGDYASVPSGPPLTVFRRLTLPYLRQCSLLQKLISGSGHVLPVPSAHLWELSQRNGSTSAQGSSRKSVYSGIGQGEQQLIGELAELEQLESRFSIPPLTTLLNDNDFQTVALKWCQHVRSEGGARTLRHIPRPVIAAPFKLMELPHLFQDLLQRYVKERCLRCGNVPDKPALCLLCGTLCCAVVTIRQCCSVNRQGECYRHAMACGAGIGVFLMLRKTNILLQRCERQALWPSPYLDAFGEEDVEGRGKPLFLSEERYAALTSMVASHGLDYSSLVLAHTSRQML